MTINDCNFFSVSLIEGRIKQLDADIEDKTKPKNMRLMAVLIKSELEMMLWASAPVSQLIDDVFAELDTAIALNDDDINRSDYPANMVRELAKDERKLFYLKSIPAHEDNEDFKKQFPEIKQEIKEQNKTVKP